MSSTAIEHLRALAARHNAYELLLALEENPQADDSCFRNLAGIVDRMVSFEVALDRGTLDGLRGLVLPEMVRPETDDLAATLAVLAMALSEAEPDRGSVHVLLEGYAKWLSAVSGIARPRFLGILPNIAPHLKELGGSGVDALIACLNSCRSTEDCEILAGCIARYQETSGSIVLAAAEIAGLAIRENSRPLVEKLMAAVSPEVMLDSKAARELLPALAKLKTSAAIGVCVAAAGDNHSSALNLARHIDEDSAGYLDSFRRIVEEVGISMIGYGTKQLPALFQKAGEERATQFVEQGLVIAHRYGRLAAEEYFDQKTAAAKKASPLE